MKKTILLCLLSGISFALMAQPGSKVEQRAKALKVGIYTRVLDLTEQEAKDFWPVFNDYEEKRRELRDEHHKLRMKIRIGFDEFDDKEFEELTDQIVYLRKKEADLFVEYYENCKRVLPIKKVALIERADREYKRELLQLMPQNNRRGPGPGGPSRPGF